jgi:pimeloyl-ACP methyl ester carboxylesterase
MSVQPFSIHVPADVLDDLQERLVRTRWPAAVDGEGWAAGASLAYMQELVDYWREEFDWQRQESSLNVFAHYRAVIDGVGIHFIHERGSGPNPMPLILTHGWPSSFYEYYKIIPLLTDPAKYGGNPQDAFDVIVPSLPGYGFSDRAPFPGGTVRTHELWLKLMTEVLGYERFAAHGDDIGAYVTNRLGLAHPDHLIGIHVTLAAKPYTETLETDQETGEARERAGGHADPQHSRGNVRTGPDGYAYLQRTKPQSLAYGLDDSPAGLAAWIIQRWRDWSDCGGEVEQRFSKDELLTNVMIYWVTGTIATSFRFYYEWAMNTLDAPKGTSSKPLDRGERISVPSAFALFQGGPSRDEAARAYNLQRYTVMPHGGHFAALEEPELLVEDMRAFFRTLR